ncbi:MAG: permease [Candidatus Sumerlaeia bacterium]|nr:permease [Candidatus Sumerlaeia bacterium]
MDLLLEILRKTYDLTREASLYLLFGLVLAGLIRAFLEQSRVMKWLSERSWKSVLRAAVVGVPLPLCSCSVLPVAAQLRRGGASRAATSSFLISTPMSGIDSFILSFGVLNPAFAVARPVSALFAGAAAGLAQVAFGGPDPEPERPAKGAGGMAAALALLGAKPPTLRKRLWDGQVYAFTDLLGSMGHYYLFGLLATGAVMSLLPENVLEGFVGGGVLGMVGVVLIGMAMYTCASASTPLAAALILKGMSPGTALVFLLAGPAMSIASLQAVRAMLGGRGLAIYTAAIFICSLASGLAFDALNTGLGWDAQLVGGGHMHEMLGPASHAGAVVLLALLVYYTAKRNAAPLLRPKAGPKQPHAAANAAPNPCCAHHPEPAASPDPSTTP